LTNTDVTVRIVKVNPDIENEETLTLLCIMQLLHFHAVQKS